MSDNNSESGKKRGSVMIVGGGIGGMQAALDLGDAGFKVHMIQKESSIGGIMSSLDKTFPTGDCAMCMISPKMVDVGRHLNIDIHTCSEIKSLSGEPGDFHAVVDKKSRYINLDKCTGCSSCVEVCPVEMPSEYDRELAKRTAINRRYAQAVPGGMVIDKVGTSPCRVDCPAEVNAHAYVTLTAKGRYEEALEVVRRTNPFPASIGRVCTHPCETACRRGDVDEPVSICYLKRFLTDWEEENGGFQVPELPEEKLEKVAVIGGGPSGMTCARDLALKGYQVTVFEKLSKAGGMLAVSIPAYRLPKDVVQKEVDQIASLGVEVKLDQALGKDFTIESLRKDGYKAIFLAIGTHRALKLRIPGEDDYEGVWDCIEFLRKVNLQEEVNVGKKVVVIGGGNAAIDSARSSLRLGAEVTIAYRRTHKEMPANSWEIDEAEEEGVDIHTLAAPVKIIGENGKVTGIECLKMELGEPDDSGRRRPVPIEGSEFVIECDTVVAAISQEPEIEPVQESGVETNRWNCIEVNDVTLETNMDGVFAGGDVVTGPSTVVQAIGNGRRGAESIHRYLRGLNMVEDRPKISDREKFIKEDIEDVEEKPRQKMPMISLDARQGNFDEVELGFSEEMALEEAGRCLNCAGCCECFLCVKVCEANAIEHEQVDREDVEFDVGAVILCPGLDTYEPRVRGELGYGRWPNVVTSLQFERILSASGPYTGKVCRPGDEKHPKKVAWIQCVGSRDKNNANPWCSSVCCMYATKQAVIAKEHDGNIEPTIFYMEMRAFGKDFDKYVDRAKNEYGVRYINAMVSTVREDAATNNLIMRYAKENGELIDEEFDMVVLSVGLQPHSNVEELAEVCNIELTDKKFPKTGHFTPVDTTHNGIYATGIFQGPKDIPETVMQGSAVAGRAMALLGEARGTEIVTKEVPPERDISGEDPKLGVFVCSCGMNIASTVDVASVVEDVDKDEEIVHCENLLYACSQDSQEKIKELIKEKGINRVVVASCTPRTHAPLFQETIREAGLNKYLFELADIREQCSWCHMGHREEATAKAKQIVKMVVGKVKKFQPVQTDSVGVTSKALVIGGGIAGMTAAVSLADQGFGVHLVEMKDSLGGIAKKVRRTLDGSQVRPFIDDTIAAIENNPKITVHLGCKVKKTDGFVGNFTTVLDNGEEFEHGAVVVTTGGMEYKPTEYNYEQSSDIVTQRELEDIIEGGLKSGSQYAMIQCVGSREEPNNYCSRVCCQDAVKNAIAIKETDPSSQVTIFYRDIRTYGLREDYYTQARELGVVFVRFDVDRKPEVITDGGQLKIKAFDMMLDREIELEVDKVVLSTGLRPHPTTDEVGEMYKLTRNMDGYFMEAHPKLRPVDFPSEGIFLAGLAHAPKNLDETVSQALAAAGRAGVLLSHTELAVSGIISKHNRDICMSCLTCFRVCPFDSPYIDEDGKISHNEVKCMGCGICAGICPAKAFQVNSFRDVEILAMVDAFGDSICESIKDSAAG